MTSIVDPFRLTERYEPPACYGHATDAERLEYAHLEALVENAVRDHQWDLPIACWTWPVTDEHCRRAFEANACVNAAVAEFPAFQLLSDWQAGRCAVCGGKSEVNDHDHQTGLVRGELCRSCNSMEAYAYLPSSPFVRYRTKNPASILGLSILYVDPFGR
jgi:Recombination endonuclease VII